ncbi:MAG: PQQ-dependent sugar dehydrogenase [Spirochaetales bacterium]
MPVPHRLAAFLCALTLLVPNAFAAQTTPLANPFQDPVDLEALPDGSLLVAQRAGTILRVYPGAKSAPELWADLTLSTMTGPELGLLGIAADRDFGSNGYVYALQAFYSGGDITLRIIRLRDSATGGLLNRVIADNLPSGSEHPGGVLAIGPDGKLYAGIGDGGSEASLVTPVNLRAVLLRFELDGTIPADNPDPKSPVWAYGLRDLRGLAWQPGTDRLYALDRGPVIPKGTMDELDLIEKGKDYGWPKHLAREVVAGVVKPVIYCSSGHSWIPGGAVFVAGGDWEGSLLFTGAGEGVLYHLTLDIKSPTKITFYEELVGGELGALIDVAQSPEGVLYLLSRTTLYSLSQD